MLYFSGMLNVLQHQHRNAEIVEEVILNLKEMFGDQGGPSRQVAKRALMSTNMSEGTSVQKHVLTMIDHLNTLEILGAGIDGESQVDIILGAGIDGGPH